MPRQSLRKYLTATQLQEYQPTVITVDNNVLIEAEKDIDNILANFATGDFRKAFVGYTKFDTCTFNDTTAVLSNFSADDGYYNRTIVEILSGANSGSRFLVNTQIGTTLTFFDATGITGAESVKIYQLAKAPFYKDFESYIKNNQNKWSKSIDERIKEATAYQYVYRVDFANSLNSKYPVKSKSLNAEDYSFTYATDEPMSIRERISPQALDILGFLTVQSLA